MKKTHLAFVLVFAGVALFMLAAILAANSSPSFEGEKASSALTKSDDTASAGQYIEFGQQGTTPTPTPPPPGGPKPIAGHDGNVGCKQNCQNVGFQNLDGKDGVVLENLIITNPGGKCISMNGSKNITIRNVTVQHCATETTLSGSGSGHNPIIPVTNSSNITITNSLFSDLAREASTKQRNNLFDMNGVSNFTFTNNEVRGLHNDLNAGGAFGGGGASDYGNRLFRLTGSMSNIKIEYNSMFDPGRNLLQIARTTISGFSFSHNRAEGRGEWDSSFEDMLNFFEASGTPSSPLVVRGNYLRNGGPSINGTAMVMGDAQGGSAANMLVEDNVLLNPGKVGIGVSGGVNFIVRNNIILGDIDVPNIHPNMKDAVGMHLHKFTGYTPVCKDHKVTGNRVYYKNQLTSGGTNHFWNPGTCDNTDTSGNVIGDTSLKREDIWPFK